MKNNEIEINGLDVVDGKVSAEVKFKARISGGKLPEGYSRTEVFTISVAAKIEEILEDAARHWRVKLQTAREQGEQYVKDLPTSFTLAELDSLAKGDGGAAVKKEELVQILISQGIDEATARVVAEKPELLALLRKKK